MMVIRSTVKPHEKSGEEGSEDRKRSKQPDTNPAVAETEAGLSVVGSRTGVADTRPTSFASPLAGRASPRDEARRPWTGRDPPPVGCVAVADEADLLEHVERSVDGRRDRRRVDRAAALDELGAGHVAVGLGQHLEERPTLWRPAQAPLMERLADRRPVAARDPGPAK